MVDLAEIQAAYYMVAATGVLVAAIYYVIQHEDKPEKLNTSPESTGADPRDKASPAINGYIPSLLIKAVPDGHGGDDTFWKWRDYDDYMSKYGMGNVVENGKNATVFKIYDGTGVFVRRGLVTPNSSTIL